MVLLRRAIQPFDGYPEERDGLGQRYSVEPQCEQPHFLRLTVSRPRGNRKLPSAIPQCVAYRHVSAPNDGRAIEGSLRSGVAVVRRALSRARPQGGQKLRPGASVVGVATAGVVPGAVIAAILGREFHSMVVSRRFGVETIRETPAVLSAAPSSVRGRRILVVDETCDTGDTIRLAVAAMVNAGASEVRTAVAFKTGVYTPDFHSLRDRERDRTANGIAKC